MESLTLFDQAMHKVTTSGLATMYMQGALTLDPNSAPFEVDAKGLAEHIAARLDQVPILRKRLVQDSFHMGALRMVDDPDFDIWNHITFATLPAPGGITELTRHLGRFSSQQLDFDRPLWCFEIIDGLEGGRLAMAQKLSHATMDGVTATRVMSCIYDAKPKRPSRYRPHAWSPEPEPSKLKLFGYALRENVDRFGVKLPGVSVKLIGMGARSLASKVTRRAGQESESAVTGLVMPPRVPQTSLGNKEISSNQRNIAFAVFELEKLKGLSRAFNCTLNDVCLLMVSESLASYFKGIGEKVDFDLCVAMPLNMRQASDRDFGNEVRVAIVNLHSTQPVLKTRLRAITVETKQAKETLRGDGNVDNSLASEIQSLVPPLAVDLLCYALKTLKPWDKLPLPCHTVFTNVPGPQGDIYVAGMRVEAPIPMIPLISPGALSIGGCSHGDYFSFGLQTCGRTVKEKNMRFFVEGLHSAYRRLSAKPGSATRRTKAKPRSRVLAAKRG